MDLKKEQNQKMIKMFPILESLLKDSDHIYKYDHCQEIADFLETYFVKCEMCGKLEKIENSQTIDFLTVCKECKENKRRK